MASSVAGKPSQSSSESYCNTKKIFEKCSFTWTIENIDYFLEDKRSDYVITSPEFPAASETKKCQWKIKLYPHGGDSDLIVYLYSFSVLHEMFKTQCHLSLQDSKNCEFIKFTLKSISFVNNYQHVLARVNKNLLLENVGNGNILKLQVEINSIVDEVSEFRVKEQDYGHVKPELKLIEDFSVMFMEQKLSDIVIVAKGTKFQAHQIILLSRSPVFAAMLKHETQEKQQKHIKIDDTEPEIVQKLLCFMYTSRIEFTDVDMATNLLIAADKYCLEDLKDLCEEYLSFNFNSSNVIDILNFADFHSVLNLKSKAMDFISRNSNSFTDSDKFTCCVKNPQLLMEISAKLANNSVNQTG